MGDSKPMGRFRLALSLGFAIILLGVITRMPWPSIWATLRQVRLSWVAASLAVGACAISLRSLRLNVVLGAKSPYKAAWSSVALGYFSSLVLPFGGGEAVKAAALARSARVPMVRALSAVGLDRLFDAGTLVVLILGILALQAEPSLRSGPLLFLCAAFTLAALSVALSVLRKEALGRCLARLPLPTRWRERLSDAYDHWHEQASRLRAPAVWGLLSAIQILAFSLDTLSAWCGLHAFPATAHLGPSAALQLNLIIMLAFALPLLPGSVGTLQASYALALAPFGIATSQAVAFGLVGQVGHAFLVAALGGLAFLMLGTGISSFRSGNGAALEP